MTGVFVTLEYGDGFDRERVVKVATDAGPMFRGMPGVIYKFFTVVLHGRRRAQSATNFYLGSRVRRPRGSSPTGCAPGSSSCTAPTPSSATWTSSRLSTTANMRWFPRRWARPSRTRPSVTRPPAGSGSGGCSCGVRPRPASDAPATPTARLCPRSMTRPGTFPGGHAQTSQPHIHRRDRQRREGPAAGRLR